MRETDGKGKEEKDGRARKPHYITVLVKKERVLLLERKNTRDLELGIRCKE